MHCLGISREATNGSGWTSNSNDVLSVSIRTSSSADVNNSLHEFSYNDLRSATGNFKLENMVGEGGFGTVYKGWLDEQTLKPSAPRTGLVVAVKKLNLQGSQGHREWLVTILVAHIFTVITIIFCFKCIMLVCLMSKATNCSDLLIVSIWFSKEEIHCI